MRCFGHKNRKKKLLENYAESKTSAIQEKQNLMIYIEHKDVHVGPIWSHNDFLRRKHTFENKGGSGWTMNGHWHSKNGTSYVHFQKETPVSMKLIEKWQDQLYNIDYKDVDVGPIWSHEDFLNRQAFFVDKGGAGWVMTGHWVTKDATSFVGFKKVQKVKIAPVIDRVNQSTTMNSIITTKNEAMETKLSGVIHDNLILTTKNWTGYV